MNGPLFWLSLAGLAFSVLLGAAFSLMEAAVLTLNRLRLLRLFGDEEPDAASEEHVLSDTKDAYFVSRLGLAVALVLATFSAFSLFAVLAVPADSASLSFERLCAAAAGTLLALPPLFLIFVHGLPRLAAPPPADEDEARLSWGISVLFRIARPLVVLSRVSRLLPVGRLLLHHRLTKSDLVSLVTDLDVDEEEEEEDETGEPGEEESDEEEFDEEEIIYNILDLEETFVREVMRPINSVVAVALNKETTAQTVRELARSTGYTRFPVYRDRIVDLIGYVSVYDLLHGEGEDLPLESYVTPAFFVPEYMRLNVLLREFLRRGVQVAVVVDEYGGSSGWVTREDVLEELVGEIEDEFDARSEAFDRRENGECVVDGSIDIDDLGEQLPLRFEDPQVDTLAGFILMTLGRIPEEGEAVETEDAVFVVERMEARRIAKVRIRFHEPEAGGGE